MPPAHGSSRTATVSRPVLPAARPAPGGSWRPPPDTGAGPAPARRGCARWRRASAARRGQCQASHRAERPKTARSKLIDSCTVALRRPRDRAQHHGAAHREVEQPGEHHAVHRRGAGPPRCSARTSGSSTTTRSGWKATRIPVVPEHLALVPQLGEGGQLRRGSDGSRGAEGGQDCTGSDGPRRCGPPSSGLFPTGRRRARAGGCPASGRIRTVEQAGRCAGPRYPDAAVIRGPEPARRGLHGLSLAPPKEWVAPREDGELQPRVPRREPLQRPHRARGSAAPWTTSVGRLERLEHALVLEPTWPDAERTGKPSSTSARGDVSSASRASTRPPNDLPAWRRSPDRIRPPPRASATSRASPARGAPRQRRTGRAEAVHTERALERDEYRLIGAAAEPGKHQDPG